MQIQNIQLESFRNYKNFNFQFDPEKKITIFIGKNGLGKTNLLESIFLLSLGKSFRTRNQEDLVKWKNDFSRCKAEILLNEESSNTKENSSTEENSKNKQSLNQNLLQLEVFQSQFPQKLKVLKKNEVKIKLGQYVGSLLTVLFQPEDLNILYLTPSLRRRYLDILLSQTDPKYLYNLSLYKKILKQRNALLNEINEKYFDFQDSEKDKKIKILLQDLEIWDQKIAEIGAQIIEKRQEFINFLNSNIQKQYLKISETSEKIEIHYKSLKNLKTLAIHNSDTQKTQKIQENFLNQLKLTQKQDIRRRKTTTGPHLDDLIFYINDHEIGTSASRGEFRTILLSMKLLEIQYIKKITDKNPILLLDDVFSELDHQRQIHLLEQVQTCQTIITTTDLQSIQDFKGLKNANTIELDQII